MAKEFKTKQNKVTTINPFVEGYSVAFVKFNEGYSLIPEDSATGREWGYFVALRDDEGTISGKILSRNSLMAKDYRSTTDKDLPARPQFAGVATAQLARKGLPYLESIAGKWLSITSTHDILRRITIDGSQDFKDCTTVALDLGEGKITAQQIKSIAKDFENELKSWGNF